MLILGVITWSNISDPNGSVAKALTTANTMGTAFGFLYFVFSSIGLMVLMRRYPEMYERAPFKLPRRLVVPLCILAILNMLVSLFFLFVPIELFGGGPLLNIKDPVVYGMIILVAALLIFGAFRVKKVPIRMDYRQPDSYLKDYGLDE